MVMGRIMGGTMAVVMLVSTLALTPAIGASNTDSSFRPRLSLEMRDSIGAFTPAATDARLAASLSRSGLASSSFRFTPATSVRLNRSVTVAVRARGTSQGIGAPQASLVAPTQSSIAPIAYNLGVAVGWKKFAVSGDVARADIAGLGRRDAVDVGVSYTDKRLTTRVQVAADRATGPQAAIIGGSGVSVDFGSSYRLTRNLDVTAGVRYRAERDDRLLPRTDNRRDSQAVYLGTAFRF
jgi:Gram-negative porin